MSKKLGAVFAALLCLTAVFSALSMSTGCTGTQKYRTNTSGELKVNAWVESKLAKPGDTINIYANTSYIDGVSVSADIMEYQHNEDGMASLSLENLSGIIYSVYVTTISLTYDSTEEHWVGTYTIPSSAGGVYVADVTATDGVNIANDNATVHLQKFYDEYLKPVQDNAETFLNGEFNDTINDIKENLTALNDTINAYGGIRGIAENITLLPEWNEFLSACGQPGTNTTVQLAYFFDNLTGFLQSTEYQEILCIFPEIEDFIMQMPLANASACIDYLLNFNLTHYLEKIDGTEGITNAYNLLASTTEYQNFTNALRALKTIKDLGNITASLAAFIASEQLMNLINTTKNYLQGNETKLQKLIQSFLAVENFTTQMTNLMQMSQFSNLIMATAHNENLSAVFENVNATFTIIESRINEMMMSSEFQAIMNSSQNLQAYITENYEGYGEFAGYMLKESIEELFYVLNAGVVVETEYFQQVGSNATVKFIAYDANGRLGDAEISILVVKVSPEMLSSLLSGTYEEMNPSSYMQLPFMSFLTAPPIEVVLRTTVITNNSTGEASATFSLQKYGIYLIYAGLNDGNKFGFGLSGFIAEHYVPVIELEKLGKFAGIDVYKSENKISENTTFNVEVPEGAEAFVGVVPLPPRDMLSSIDMPWQALNLDYNSSYQLINETGNVSLKVNMPVSLIYILTGTHLSISNIPSRSGLNISSELNISFGILLASDVNITVTVPRVVKGERATLTITPESGIPIFTVGLAAYSNGIDVVAQDLKMLFTILYRGAVMGSAGMNPTELISMRSSVVWGFLYRAYLTVPVLSSTGEYSIISITNVDGTKLGTAFTQITVNPPDITPPTISHTAMSTWTDNTALPVTAEITDDVGVTNAILYYRKIGEQNYTPVGISVSGSIWNGTIPASAVIPFGLEYYIWATDGRNNVTTQVYTVNIPDTTPPTIVHTPVSTCANNTDLPIAAEITDNVEVTSAVLYYRKVGDEDYIPVQMSKSAGDIWNATISASAVTPVGLQYYVWTTDGTNNISTSVYSIGPDTTPPSIAHVPVVTATEDTNIIINSTITENTSVSGIYGVVSASLFCRVFGGTYTEIPMSNPEDDIWTANIPANMVTSIGLEYYIWITDGTNNISTPVCSITVPTTTTTSVDGNEVTVAYNGTGTLTVTHVTVDEIETTPKKDLPSGKKHIGIFIDVDTTGTIHDAFITVKYDDSDVAGIDESKLMMYYWNETTSEWMLIDDSGVWTNNNTVWARITHFTIFAPMAEKTAAGPAPAVSWLIYVGVFSAVIIMVVISLAVTVKRKKKTPPSNPYNY